MTRAVVHFGLHKCGSSTTEATLQANAAALEDRMRIVTRKSWPEVSGAAKAFSRSRTQADLSAFAGALEQRLAAVPEDGRALCLSNVDLSGALPGLPGTADYAHLVPLVSEAAQRVSARFGAGNVTLLASLRASRDWLHSLYWQTLKVSRQVNDFETFAARMGHVADLGPVLDAVAAAIAPLPLIRTPLEQSRRTPLGPATPVLTAMGLGEDDIAQLTPVPARKVSPPIDVQSALLNLNRAALDEKALADAKAMVIALVAAQP